MAQASRRKARRRAPGAGQPIHWPAIAAYLNGRGEKLLPLYRDLVAAFGRGELPGRCPDQATFYRGFPKVRDAQPQAPAPPADAPAPRRRPKKAGSPRLRAAVARLETTRGDHEAAAKALVEAGRFSRDDQLRYQDKMKRSDGRYLTAAAAKGPAAVEALAAEIEHVTTTYRERAAVGDAFSVHALATASDRPAEIVLINDIDPDNPVFGTGEPSHSSRARHEAPQPAHGQIIGHTRERHDQVCAAARATMITPVLNGAKNAKEAERYWRAEFAKVVSAPGHMGIEGITRDICRKYRNVSERQIFRWIAAVRAGREQAFRLGLPEPSLISTLLHDYPEERRGPRFPALKAEVQQLFKDNPGWTPDNIAEHLREAGKWTSRWNRTIERYIEEIPDRQRALARGGPAGPEILRTRLIRQASHPNHVWHMDHSWISQELVLPGFKGPFRDEVTRAYALMQFALEDRNLAGWVERKAVQGIWMTKIIDLCTRKVLAIRLWPSAPNTRTTLLALRDAVELYGLPDILYTDNGSDLKNHTMRAVLQAAEILEVHSHPWTPQGGGADERGHLTIKTKILPHLAGWCGGKRKEWHVDDLLTLPDLEREIWNKVDAWMNGREHSTTRRIPNRHYEEEIGARPLSGTGRREVSPEVWLPLLTVMDDVVLHNYGIALGGHKYYHESFGSLMKGRALRVYRDPYRPRFAHVALPRPDGTLHYLGMAERYTHPESPPPAAWVQAQEEARWRKEQDRLATDRARVRLAEERVEAARLIGEVDGPRLAAATPELALIGGGRPMLALPPPANGGQPEPAASTQDEPAETEPVLPAAAQSPAQRRPRSTQGTPETSLDGYLRPGRKNTPALINPFED